MAKSRHEQFHDKMQSFHHKMHDKHMCLDWEDRKHRRRFLWGIIVLIVGVGLLLHNVFPWFSFNYAWPFIIIAVGVHLIMVHPK